MIPAVITYQLSPRSNRLVTLPPGYIRRVGDPLKTHVISYDSQYKPTDHKSRVLRRVDGPNLSKSCVSVAFLFLITCTSADQSTFVGYPSEDCRRYPVDTRPNYNNILRLDKKATTSVATRRMNPSARGHRGVEDACTRMD